MREAHYAEGVYSDVVVMAVLREEWAAGRLESTKRLEGRVYPQISRADEAHRLGSWEIAAKGCVPWAFGRWSLGTDDATPRGYRRCRRRIDGERAGQPERTR